MLRASREVQESKRVAILQTIEGFEKDLEQACDDHEARTFIEWEVAKARSDLKPVEESISHSERPPVVPGELHQGEPAGALRGRGRVRPRALPRAGYHHLKHPYHCRPCDFDPCCHVDRQKNSCCAAGAPVASTGRRCCGFGEKAAASPRPGSCPARLEGGVHATQHHRERCLVAANLLSKTATWLAGNLWALVVALGGPLVAAAHEAMTSSKKPKGH